MADKEIIKLLAELYFEVCQGTVRDKGDYDAERDSEVLRKAMKGLGTDEKKIIEITARRTRKQRVATAIQYKQLFGRDLLGDLKSELSGDFQDLVLALYTPPALYDAQCMRNAIKGLGTDEAVLIEILASRTNDQIKAINAAYKKEYNLDLEKDIVGDTSGDFRSLLVALNNAGRDESFDVDEGKAIIDAEALYKAGEKKLGTDESTFIRILCSRSYSQLRATFKVYSKIADKDIIESIMSEFSGDIEDGLIAVVQNARCPPAYFARLLYKAMKGLGTNEGVLNRVIVARCEDDMEQIKDVFERFFKSSLEKYIKDDTSGDYEKLLLALI